MRILLIPAAGGVGLGPMTNLLAVAQEAVGAGHSVAFLAKAAWAAEVRQLGYPAFLAATPAPYRGNPPPPYNLGAVVTRLGWLNENYIRTSIGSERAAITSFAADVVITTLQFTAPISAKIEGRPSVAIFSWADGPGFSSPLYETVQHVTSGEDCYNQVLEEHGLPPLANICDLAFLRSDLRVAATIPDLQPELGAFPDINFVGHLLSRQVECGELPEDAKNWSGTGPVVYVYLGPGDIPPERWVPTLVDAFKDTDFRVMVTLAQTTLMPSSMPVVSNIRFFERLPGLTAIQAADVVISHGGANTVNNALIAGKPQIVFPDGYAERDYNGRAIARLGAGINCSTSQLNKDGLLSVIREVLVNGAFGRKAGALGRIIDSHGGARRVVELVENLA